jgi:hypothetical protein
MVPPHGPADAESLARPSGVPGPGPAISRPSPTSCARDTVHRVLRASRTPGSPATRPSSRGPCARSPSGRGRRGQCRRPARRRPARAAASGSRRAPRTPSRHRVDGDPGRVVARAERPPGPSDAVHRELGNRGRDDNAQSPHRSLISAQSLPGDRRRTDAGGPSVDRADPLSASRQGARTRASFATSRPSARSCRMWTVDARLSGFRL